MRKYFSLLLALFSPAVALADDARMPELFHLLAAAQACKIDLNVQALHFINGFSEKVDKRASEALADTIKAKVDAEIASKGAVTVCWDTWDKMKENGFLQPYYPPFPAPSDKH